MPFVLIGTEGMSKVLGEEPTDPADRLGDAPGNEGMRWNGWACAESNINGDADIPTEVLVGTGVSEEEMREALRAIEQAAKPRTKCCFGVGYLGPLCLLVWWLDMLECWQGMISSLWMKPLIKATHEACVQQTQRFTGKSSKPRFSVVTSKDAVTMYQITGFIPTSSKVTYDRAFVRLEWDDAHVP